MGGGRWDYHQHVVTGTLEDAARDAQHRWPQSAKALRKLSQALSEILHDMDWDLSGDTEQKDDQAFDSECLMRLRNAVEEEFNSADIRNDPVLGFVREMAEDNCQYGDNCPNLGSRHYTCKPCKARQAIKQSEEAGSYRLRTK